MSHLDDAARDVVIARLTENGIADGLERATRLRYLAGLDYRVTVCDASGLTIPFRLTEGHGVLSVFWMDVSVEDKIELGGQAAIILEIEEDEWSGDPILRWSVWAVDRLIRDGKEWFEPGELLAEETDDFEIAFMQAVKWAGFDALEKNFENKFDPGNFENAELMGPIKADAEVRVCTADR